MTKWEYKYEVLDAETVEMVLATLGEQGWELVSVVKGFEYEEYFDCLYYFKRPKEGEDGR